MSTQEKNEEKSSFKEKIKSCGYRVRRKIVAAAHEVGSMAEAFFDPKSAVEKVEGQSMEDFAKESDKRQAKETKDYDTSKLAMSKSREDDYLR